MKLKTLLILGTSTLVASSNASLVGNLYLAQGDGINANAFVDQVFEPANSGFSTVGGNVVTVGASGWNIKNVQAEYFDFNSLIISGGLTSGLLTVSTFSSTPNVNHTAGVSVGSGIIYSGIVTSSITNVAGPIFNFETNTSGIGALQGLVAGQYLVTFSLNAALSTFGQGFHTVSTDNSTNGWVRNPGGAFGFPAGGNWDTYASTSGDVTGPTQFSLGINGTNAVPEPASLAVLGLGALALIRRRRNKNS